MNVSDIKHTWIDPHWATHSNESGNFSYFCFVKWKDAVKRKLDSQVSETWFAKIVLNFLRVGTDLDPSPCKKC